MFLLNYLRSSSAYTARILKVYESTGIPVPKIGVNVLNVLNVLVPVKFYLLFTLWNFAFLKSKESFNKINKINMLFFQDLLFLVSKVSLFLECSLFSRKVNITSAKVGHHLCEFPFTIKIGIGVHNTKKFKKNCFYQNL